MARTFHAHLRANRRARSRTLSIHSKTLNRPENTRTFHGHLRTINRHERSRMLLVHHRVPSRLENSRTLLVRRSTISHQSERSKIRLALRMHRRPTIMPARL
jgi:hypothetical protein